ncbi:hypothetical protein FJT64_027623 [Amphibalanus amphitrite]|uniref:Uncharacterized protein n=1 Tax=Amphibalanus amphitrite TaxID=1232801 RepID=A0A6A4W161_AMPAM|nr:hypothetical protein FJT64_027623 [Amphibalanus amphitrite]
MLCGVLYWKSGKSSRLSCVSDPSILEQFQPGETSDACLIPASHHIDTGSSPPTCQPKMTAACTSKRHNVDSVLPAPTRTDELLVTAPPPDAEPLAVESLAAVLRPAAGSLATAAHRTSIRSSPRRSRPPGHW